MGRFLKLFFILIYALLMLFSKHCAVFSAQNNIIIKPVTYNISETKSALNNMQEAETYYTFLKKDDTQLFKNNKNNEGNFSSFDEFLVSNSNLSLNFHEQNSIKFNYIDHNSSKFLKYTINTRAP